MSPATMELKTNLKPRTIVYLQDLLQANIDSAKGYEQVAEASANPIADLQLQDRVAERRANSDELSRLIEQNGASAESDGSWLAAFHRNWIAIKATLTSSSGNSGPLLAEIERGERYLASRYEQALKDNPGSAVSDVLHRQLAGVKKIIESVQAEQTKLGS